MFETGNVGVGNNGIDLQPQVAVVSEREKTRRQILGQLRPQSEYIAPFKDILVDPDIFQLPEKQPAWIPAKVNLAEQQFNDIFYDGRYPKTKFAFWVVAHWPKELGKRNHVAIGYLWGRRKELHLLESDLPSTKTKNREEVERIKQEIVRLVNTEVRPLEEALVTVFINNRIPQDEGLPVDSSGFVPKFLLRGTRLTAEIRTDRFVKALKNPEVGPREAFRVMYLTKSYRNGFELGGKLADLEKLKHERETNTVSFVDYIQSPDFSLDLVGELRKKKLVEHTFQDGFDGLARAHDRKERIPNYLEQCKNLFVKEGYYKTDKFSFWVVSSFKKWCPDETGLLPDRDQLNPLLLGVVYQLRNELGLSDSELPDITEKEKEKEVQAKLNSLRPLLRQIELQVSAVLQREIGKKSGMHVKIEEFKETFKETRADMRDRAFCRQFLTGLTFIDTFELGKKIGVEIKLLHTEKASQTSQKVDTFSTFLEEEQKQFEAVRDGSWRGPESSFIHNGVLGLTFLAQYGEFVARRIRSKDKSLTFTVDEARQLRTAKRIDDLCHQLSQKGYTLHRFVQRATTSPEGESIFHNPSQESVKRNSIGLTAGLIAAKMYQWNAELSDSTMSRSIQALLGGGAFLAGRINTLQGVPIELPSWGNNYTAIRLAKKIPNALLKTAAYPARLLWDIMRDIRWTNVAKSGARGALSAGLTLGLELLVRMGAHQTGLQIDSSIGGLSVQVVVARMFAGNIMSSAGINFGSEWAVNRVFNNKNVVNGLTEYLFMRNTDVQRAEYLLRQELGKRENGYSMWGIVVEVYSGKKKDFESLIRAAQIVLDCEFSLRALLIHSPIRYGKRILHRDGLRYEIDANEMLAELTKIKLQIYQEGLLHCSEKQRRELHSMFFDERESVAQLLVNRVQTTRVAHLAANMLISSAVMVGSQLPEVKRVLSEAVTTLFGKERIADTSLNTLSINAITPLQENALFHNENDNFFFKTREINSRVEQLGQLLGWYHQKDVQGDFKADMFRTHNVTEQQLADFERFLERNNLTYQDLRIILNATSIVREEEINEGFQKSLIQNYHLTPEQASSLTRQLQSNTFTNLNGFPEDVNTAEKVSAMYIGYRQLYPGFIRDPVVSDLAKGLASTKHSDIGALISVLSAQKDLKGSARSLLDRRRYLDDFYGYVDPQEGSLLARLGVNTKTLEYQLRFIPNSVLSNEAKQQLVSTRSPLTIVENGSGGVFVIVQEKDSSFVAFTDKPYQIHSLDTLHKLSQQSDSTGTFTHPGFALFMAEGDRIFNTIDNSYLLNNSPLLLGIIRRIDADAALNISEADAQKLVIKAMSGDLDAFKQVEKFISTADMLAATTKAQDDEPMMAILSSSKKPSEIISNIRLFYHKLSLDPVYEYGSKNRSVLDIADASSVTDALNEATTIGVFTGSVPINEAMAAYMNVHPIHFFVGSEHVGQYYSSLQVTRSSMPKDVQEYLFSIEGDTPTKPYYRNLGEFVTTFAKGKLRYESAHLWNSTPLANVFGFRHVAETGASEPAMQLVKMLGFDEQAQGSTLHHPELYSVSYAQKLFYAAGISKSIPPELLTRAKGVAQIQNNQLDASTPFGKWSELRTTLDEKDDKFIADVCYKLEQFIAAQRLLAVYGEEGVTNAYLNYVPMGISKEGVPIFGFEAAAQYYFGKSLSDSTFSKGEKLMLVALIQAPQEYAPYRRISLSGLSNVDKTLHVIQIEGKGVRFTDADIERGYVIVDTSSVLKAQALAQLKSNLKNKGIISANELKEIELQINSAKFVNKIPNTMQTNIPPSAQVKLAQWMKENRGGSMQLAGGSWEAGTGLPIALKAGSAEWHKSVDPTSFLDSAFNVENVAGFHEITPTAEKLDMAANVLSIAITRGLQMGYSGNALAASIKATVEEYGYHPSADFETVLNTDVISQTANTQSKAIQCVVGDKLIVLLANERTSRVSYLGGWTYADGKTPLDQAHLYIDKLFASGQTSPKIYYNSIWAMKVNTDDSQSLRAIIPGDHLVAQGGASSEGHIGLVINSGIDIDPVSKKEKPFIEIWDVNFNSTGRPRKIKLYADQIQEYFAGVKPEQAKAGFKANIGIIRSAVADANQIEQTSIQRKIRQVGDVFYLDLPTENRPITKVEIPTFQKAVLTDNGQWVVKNYPGVVIKVSDEFGNEISKYDPTDILGKVPIPPGSTIKPFIYAFLKMHLKEVDGKPFDPSKTLLPNQPGKYSLIGGLPVQNSEPKLNILDKTNVLTLDQSLAESTNVGFEYALKEYLESDTPPNPQKRWSELQQFLRSVGLELVDQMGKPLGKPTAFAAIGSDVYIKNIDNLSNAYAMLAKPENYLNAQNAEDARVIEALNATRKILMDNNLKASKTPSGFEMDRVQQALMKSNGSSFFKTGTVGTTMVIDGKPVQGTTYLLAAGVDRLPNGQLVSTVVVMSGQEATISNGTPRLTQSNLLINLQNKAFGSVGPLPVVLETIANMKAKLTP